MIETKIIHIEQLNKKSKENEVTYQFTKKKGSMHINDITNIYDALEKKGQATKAYFSPLLIRVLNGDRWATYKTKEAYLEYYEGKVKDVTKFTDNIIEFTITAYVRD